MAAINNLIELQVAAGRNWEGRIGDSGARPVPVGGSERRVEGKGSKTSYMTGPDGVKEICRGWGWQVPLCLLALIRVLEKYFSSVPSCLYDQLRTYYLLSLILYGIINLARVHVMRSGRRHESCHYSYANLDLTKFNFRSET